MYAKADVEHWCAGCVYYPPNLPLQAYSESDWQELQALAWAHSCQPGSEACIAVRKTSCSLVDMRALHGR